MNSRRKNVNFSGRAIDDTRQRRAEDIQIGPGSLGEGLVVDSTGKIQIEQAYIQSLIETPAPAPAPPTPDLAAIGEVELSEVQGDQVLTFDGTASVWTNKDAAAAAPEGGSSNLDGGTPSSIYAVGTNVDGGGP